MILFSHVFIVLFLALIMSFFSGSFPFCNLLIIYVVFLALVSPGLPMAIFGVLLAGAVNGGMSVAPFSIFILSFLWLFGMVRVLRNLVQQNSLLLVFFAVLAGIVLENFFIATFLSFRGIQVEVWSLASKMFLGEILSALILVPLLMVLLHMLEPWLFYSRRTGVSDLVVRSHHPN